MHVEIKQALSVGEVRSSQHISSEVVDEVEKLKDDVHRWVEEVKKFYQDF